MDVATAQPVQVQGATQAVRLTVNASDLRHPKETVYFGIAAVIGVLVWLSVIWFVVALLIPLAVTFLVLEQYFKAVLYGGAVRVSERQFPQLHRMVTDIAQELKLSRVPEIFVVSGQGALNALAVAFLRGKYVLLYGELVDLMLRRGAYDELRMIIGHELAHHALGHASVWRDLLIYPARLIPFFGAAYGRACELSADRVGMALTGDAAAAQRALLAVTIGSEALAGSLDLDAFVAQEHHVPPIMGIIHELFATHPRMTRRILELQEFERLGGLRAAIASTG